MTLMLETKSHGEIESGFYRSFIKLSRIGKYAFETKDLCSLAQNLAENSRLREARIFGYDINKFWQLEEEYDSTYVLKSISSFIEDNLNEITDFLRENLKLSIEDKTRLMTDKIEIPVSVHRFKKFIKIGEYEIENSHFAQMIYYLLQGGFSGWDGEVPDFAKSAISAVKTSKNPLFK